MTQQEQLEAIYNVLADLVGEFNSGGNIPGPEAFKKEISAITALIQEARKETAESFHRRIFDEFGMLPRIQDAYRGDRNIDVRKLQKLMCDFERDVTKLSGGSNNG